MADKLFILDGMGFAFRAFFAIRGLSNSRGQSTNAVYGFSRILLKVIREQHPSHLVVVFDAPGKTFRDDMYKEYKANRPEAPPELVSQFPLIDKVVEAFDIPVLRVEGVEADDVMATLAKQAESEGREAVLVSTDKDLLQMVTEKTQVFDPYREDGFWYGPKEVKERYGVPAERVVDVLALMGDSSDNVPGVKGIGEKTAKKLVEKYESLDNLYDHIDELKGKQKERLENDKDKAYLSRDLVTIDSDVELDADWDDFEVTEPNKAKVADVFHELEFHSLLEEFMPDNPEEDAPEYTLVLTEAALKKVVKEMKSSGLFALDTETTSTDPMAARLVGISMSCEAGTGYYIPVSHAEVALQREDGNKPYRQLDADTALGISKALLQDPQIEKAGHNIKYDLVVLRRAGVEVKGIAMDTMVASYLTDPSRLRHNLNDVSLHYLRRKLIPISDLLGTGSKAITFDNVPLGLACEYAAEDADITWRLVEIFQESMEERGVAELFRDVELPLIYVLADMEMAGVAIDADVFEGLRKEIVDRLGALEHEIFELAGEPFKINSPKQLQVVLFEKLKLPPIRKTKTGYSTDVDVLEQLSREHPLPEKILEYRGLEKLRGTYVEALPKLVNPETGRIHTSFNQTVAATGRLSSSDPNLQNIPVRTELGRRIRQGFVAGGADQRLISADYSQIELRILAHLSGDKQLNQAFQEDLDIHRDTAARVFGVAAEDVTPEMRRQAKTVNFGVIYGISAFGLAKSLGISNKEADAFIRSYFEQYPGVRNWIDDTIAKAKVAGYVKTLMNRRRFVPDLSSPDANARRAAERVATNTPVQGTAAEVIKVAMIRLDRELKAKTHSRLLLQVHDELLVEGPAGEAEDVAAMMKAVMEDAIALDVPLKVDVGVGKNWDEVH